MKVDKKTLVVAAAVLSLFLSFVAGYNVYYSASRQQFNATGQDDPTLNAICLFGASKRGVLYSNDMRPEVAISRGYLSANQVEKILIDSDIVCIVQNGLSGFVAVNSDTYEIVTDNQCLRVRWKFASSLRVANVTLYGASDFSVSVPVSIGYEYDSSDSPVDMRLWRKKGKILTESRDDGFVLKNPATRGEPSSLTFKRASMSGDSSTFECSFVPQGKKLNFGIFLGDKVGVIIGDGDSRTCTLRETMPSSNPYRGTSRAIERKVLRSFKEGQQYYARFSDAGGKYTFEIAEQGCKPELVFQHAAAKSAFKSFDNPGLLIFPNSSGVLVQGMRITVGGE